MLNLVNRYVLELLRYNLLIMFYKPHDIMHHMISDLQFVSQ